jgi:hypothetical protein
MKVLHYLARVLSILALAMESSRLGAQEASLEAIFAAWQRCHEDVHSLRCVLTGKRLFPKNSYARFTDIAPDFKGKVVPAQDESYPLRFALSVDFDKGFVRNEEASWILNGSNGKFQPYKRVWLYDGDVARRLEPRVENTSEVYTPSEYQPELYLNSEKQTRAMFLNHTEYPVFFACGVVGAVRDIAPGTLRLPPYKDFLRLQGRGRIGERSCVILRTAPETGLPLYRDYWVDADRGGAILRYTVWSHDRILFQTDIEYEEGQPGGWRPKRWVEALYEGGSIWRAENLEVTEWSLNPEIPPKEFQVQLRPGMIVNDNRDNKFYRVDTDGQTLNELAFRRDGQWVETVRPRRSWFWWLFGACVVLGLHALLGLWQRRRKKKRLHAAG